MGYIIKSEVLDALKDDMGDTKACYEKKEEKAIVDMCYQSMEYVIDGLPQYRVDNAIEICDQKKLEEMTRTLVRVTEKIKNFFRQVGNECEKSGLGTDFAAAIAARILAEGAERGKNGEQNQERNIIF